MGFTAEQELKEKELLAACKKYDRNSQKELFKNFYGYALNVCKLFTYSKEDAEEVVNDCFIKLFENIKLVDEKKPLKPYLRKILVNSAIDLFRKNKKHYFHLDVEETNEAKLHDDVFSSLSFNEILEQLNKLPEFYRMVFILYELENYTHDEIALRLKISVSSSRVYLMRAKNKLKILLSNYKND